MLKVLDFLVSHPSHLIDNGTFPAAVAYAEQYM